MVINPLDHHACLDIDPFLHKGSSQRFCDRFSLEHHNGGERFENSDLDSQICKEGSKFTADVAAANDSELLGRVVSSKIDVELKTCL